MKTKPHTDYSPIEERWNVWSHLIGFVLGLVALAFLLMKGIKSGDATRLVAYLIYGLSVLTLFLASTLYHSAKDEVARKRLKIFDHCAIYLQIAGSYVPFMAIAIKGTWAIVILSLVWSLAIAGIILKLFFTGRFKLVSTLSYVLLGWIAVVAIKPMVQHMSNEALLWLAVGGVFYTVGAVLYSIKKIPYNHAIFHVFVVAGTFSHFIVIYWYI